MNDQDTRPLRTCDIVMKGGITSGVVYPKAIVTLAKRFLFKNLGGTSAGAIAASAAAAAEYRRTVHGCDTGFALLGKLGDFLAEKPPGESQTRLFSLFRPNASTRRLFEILTSALGGGKSAALAVLRSATEQYPGFTLLGTAPGFTLAVLSLLHLDAGWLAGVWAVVGILLGLAGGAVAAAVSFALDFVREVPDNHFGLCSGIADTPHAAPSAAEPLTTWLTKYLDEVAGFEPGHRPLIFADLWGTHESDIEKYPRSVNLEMMTTNLTHGRPYRLPFRDDADLRESYLFYFRKDEFLRLFPEHVVEWMIAHPRPIPPGEDRDGQAQTVRDERARYGFFPLPAPADMPVVVATRMSLSFPILLGAVPLHSVERHDRDKSKEPAKPGVPGRLDRCWFTDGGLCSNFPVHFFDGPLPRRPTFSIDLTQKPDDTQPGDLVPEMDDSNRPVPVDLWNRFDCIVSADPAKPPVEKPGFGKLTGFIATLISTMQNWNDATQGRLPGFRDRIVRIPLTSRQGGLNLNMPPELVTFLTNQGEACAALLMKHFDVPPADEIRPMTWDNHRWIRLRAMLVAMEKMVEQTLITCEQPESDDPGYEAWLHSLLNDGHTFPKGPSYRATKAQIEAALKTLERLRIFRTLWENAGTAVKAAPRPRSVLRPRAQV